MPGMSLIAGALVMAAMVVPRDAAVIHLKNGGMIAVDGCRDAGDQIECDIGAGQMQVPKADIERIDRAPTEADRPRQVPPQRAVAPGPGSPGVSSSSLQFEDYFLLAHAMENIAEAAIDETLSGREDVAYTLSNLRRLWEEWRGLANRYREASPFLSELLAKGRRALEIFAEVGREGKIVGRVTGPSSQQMQWTRRELEDLLREIKKIIAERRPLRMSP